MSLTNFAALTDEQLTVWSRDFWQAARNRSFISRFMGTGPESMVQRITELTKSEKGARAVMTLVQDLTGDGVAGDRTLEGNEEALDSDDEVILIDQLRNATRHQGKMADQKSVVRFREQARNKLSYWMADRLDQLAFLTLSGVAYTQKNRNGARTGSDLANLEFAASVTAPSTARSCYVKGTTGLEFTTATASATDAAEGMLTYDMIIDLKAYAKDHYIRPLTDAEGMETYNMFVSPVIMAKLKQDTDFLAAWRSATPRSKDNLIFKGANAIHLDGVSIYEHRHVYQSPTLFAGETPDDGTRCLFCGAQALGFADIGMPEWNEQGFDYDNQQGIKIGKIFGMLKPQFKSIYETDTTTPVDFGVITVDVNAV